MWETWVFNRAQKFLSRNSKMQKSTFCWTENFRVVFRSGLFCSFSLRQHNHTLRTSNQGAGVLSLLGTPFPSLTEEQSGKRWKGCLSATFPSAAAQLTDLQFSRVAGSLLGCLPFSRSQPVQRRLLKMSTKASLCLASFLSALVS